MFKFIIKTMDALVLLFTIVVVGLATYIFGPMGFLISFISCVVMASIWAVCSTVYVEIEQQTEYMKEIRDALCKD